MDRSRNMKSKRPLVRVFVFPVSVLVIYGILLVTVPEKAFIAFRSSGHISINIFFPLGLVFILLLFLNLFLKPAYTMKFLGRRAGIKGIILSATAGIFSMGPIYAWYPMLKELRQKGADNSLIAIFLGNRAVKPFLLPVMISYFGWIYVLTFTVLTIFGSIALGYGVGALVRD